MKINKFFVKRFRTFFLIMMVPTLVIFSVFVGFMGQEFNNTLITQGQNSLKGIQTNFDLVVRNAVYQQNLMTSDNKMMLSLKKLIISGGSYDYSDGVFLDDLQTALRSVIYSHSYIDSIYIYLDGYDDFFTSTQTGLAKLADYYDKDWNKYYVKDTNMHSQWIVKRTVSQYSYEPAQPVLTVFQRMSSTNGVIVVNINEEKLINIFNSIVTDPEESAFILDENYAMILSNRGNAGPAALIGTGFFKKQQAAGKTDFTKLSGQWIMVGKEKYLLSCSNYPESQIYFVTLISGKSLLNQYKDFIANFIIIFAIDLVVVFLLTYITTKRNFKQIDYMIDVFGRAEQGLVTEFPKKRKQDEYDVIMNNVIGLFLKTTQMNKVLVERQHSLEVAELTALQLQINPHFLLNTLQTMDLEATKMLGPSTLNEIIQNLSDILKYALGDPSKPVSLREELAYLKEYVSIQKYRFGDKFIVYYEVDNELLDYHVFRLMLQPLLENSILHGVRALQGTGFIKIKVIRRGAFLYIRTIDNGVGLTHSEVEALYAQINDAKSRSIGLTNVNRRLTLEYGNECGLHIHSKKDVGMCISFKVPLQ